MLQKLINTQKFTLVCTKIIFKKKNNFDIKPYNFFCFYHVEKLKQIQM